VSESSKHLSAIELEQMAEEGLSPAETADAQGHLASCRQCAGELDSYRQLYRMLGGLPRFAPSPGFSEHVMARVEIASRESIVAAWLRRLIPTTKRGWLLLGTIVTAPATPVLALFSWILLQPLVTPSALVQWVLLRIQATTQASVAWLAEQATGIWSWEMLATTYSTMQAVPASALAGVFAMISVCIPLSAWGLLKLTRTPGARVTYAN
jgi:hypothetical protein